MLLLAAMTLPLLRRRTLPLPVLAVVAGAFVARQLLQQPAIAGDLGLLVALYSLGAHAGWRTAAAGTGVLGAATLAFLPLVPGESAGSSATFFLFVVALPVAVGAYQRFRRDPATRPGAAVEEPGGRAAAPGPAAGPPALGQLTPREHEVLGLLAHGRSNAEIAAALHLSPETVKTHVARILRKLGLANRTAAAVFAHRHGVPPG